MSGPKSILNEGRRLSQSFARALTLGFALVLAWSGAAAALTIDTAAREAILIDYETGHVLFEKNADVPMPPASMSKIMTVYLAFERLKDGRLSLDDEITVSRRPGARAARRCSSRSANG